MSKIVVSWKSEWVNDLMVAIKGEDHARLGHIQYAAERGYDMWRTWVDIHQGTVLQDSEINGFYQVPTEAIADLHQLLESYKSIVKAQLSVGIGKYMLEAEQARKLSEQTERQVVFHSEEAMQALDGERNDSLIEKLKELSKSEDALEKAVNVKRLMGVLATVGLLGGTAHIGAKVADDQVKSYIERLQSGAIQPKELDHVKFVKQWQPISLSHLKVKSPIWDRLDPLLQHAAYRETSYNKVTTHPDLANKPVGIVGLTPLATIDAVQSDPDRYRAKYGDLVRLVHDQSGSKIDMGTLEKQNPARWRSIVDAVIPRIKGDHELYLQAANHYIDLLRKERGGSDLMAGLAWNAGRYAVPTRVTPEVAEEALKQQYALNLLAEKKQEHVNKWPSVREHMLSGLKLVHQLAPNIAEQAAKNFQMHKHFGQHLVGEQVQIPYRKGDDDIVRGNFTKMKKIALDQRNFVGPMQPDEDAVGAMIEDARKSEAQTADDHKANSDRVVGHLNDAIKNRPQEVDDHKELKRQLVKLVKQVKQYAPVLDQIAQQNPKLHATVAGMVQLMGVMAQKLELTKAEQEEVEELVKKARVVPKVFPVGSKLTGAAGGPDLPTGKAHNLEQTQQGDEQGEMRSMRSGMIRNPEQPAGTPVSSRANPQSYVPKGRQRA